MMFLLNHKLQKFNWHVIFNIIGYVLIAEGILLALPLVIDLIYDEQVWSAYLIGMALCIGIGYPMSILKRKHTSYFAKDGMIAVGLS